MFGGNLLIAIIELRFSIKCKASCVVKKSAPSNNRIDRYEGLRQHQAEIKWGGLMRYGCGRGAPKIRCSRISNQGFKSGSV